MKTQRGAGAARETSLLPALRSADGGVAGESAAWQVCYDAFVRMAEGADVRVWLGGEEVALGREHLEAPWAVVAGCVRARCCD